jgi:hypothetical protein
MEPPPAGAAGVEVEHDLLRRPRMGSKKQVDQQPLDRPWIMRDLTIAIDHGRAVLQPVEGALAGLRRATPVSGLEPPRHHAKHRIVPQLIVIDQVFVAERDAQHPLADQGRDVVHDPVASTTIDKAAGEPLDQPDRPIRHPQQ